MLDDFEEIKVAVAYRIDGEETTWFPADLDALARAEIVYETLPGWKCETTGMRGWDDLPERAKAYVEFIEEYLGSLRCKYIGTGPDREHMIVR